MINDPDGSKAAAKKLPEKKEEGGDKNMKSKSGNSLRSVLAHIVLIVLVIYVSVLLLYSDYQCNPFSCGAAKGFRHCRAPICWKNLKNVANDGSFPMFRGIINSICISTARAGLCNLLFRVDGIWSVCFMNLRPER